MVGVSLIEFLAGSFFYALFVEWVGGARVGGFLRRGVRSFVDGGNLYLNKEPGIRHLLLQKKELTNCKQGEYNGAEPYHQSNL